LPEIGLHQLDCIFVPGLAFDHAGWRLGRGGGYYDFALAQIRANAKHGNPIPHPGLMFACQEVEKIPAEAHDQRLSCILTEEGLRLFPGL
jgi:5-formyltetrahydrofolate cyclo-ligase